MPRLKGHKKAYKKRKLDSNNRIVKNDTPIEINENDQNNIEDIQNIDTNDAFVEEGESQSNYYTVFISFYYLTYILFTFKPNTSARYRSEKCKQFRPF